MTYAAEWLKQLRSPSFTGKCGTHSLLLRTTANILLLSAECLILHKFPYSADTVLWTLYHYSRGQFESEIQHLWQWPLCIRPKWLSACSKQQKGVTCGQVVKAFDCGPNVPGSNPTCCLRVKCFLWATSL